MTKELELVAFELDKNKFIIGTNPNNNLDKGTAQVDNGVRLKIKEDSEERLRKYIKEFYQNYKGKKKTIPFKLEKIRKRYNFFK